MSKSDPIADALDGAAQIKGGAGMLRIDYLFGDRPAVLEAIKRARYQRKLSHQQIADLISTPEAKVSSAAVQNWLKVNGPGT